jgi:hypothetical protein
LVRIFFSSAGFGSAPGTKGAGGNPKLKLLEIGAGGCEKLNGGGLPNIFCYYLLIFINDISFYQSPRLFDEVW